MTDKDFKEKFCKNFKLTRKELKHKKKFFKEYGSKPVFILRYPV